ncbi:MAG: glycosyltransferase family 2 protein [Candidatus Omnitrophica bacterium]|nr:glycosyltransferase family 2 protein [Candidatus Omnitrophota bacterium]
MQKINVTVAVIAKNEEKNISRCLESVKWADDIVVVDGFSTDRTVEIAKSMGARVIQHRFTGSFADDRNAANDNAKYDWVLHIDADDVVTDDFRMKLAEVIARNDGVVVYKFRRRNFFLGHSMDFGGFHHYIPNLVNRRYARYEGAVHETPIYKGNVGKIDADIDHHPFDTIEQFVSRQNRYSTIAAQKLLEKEGVLATKAIKKGLIGKSLKIFWKSYVKKQGYKDGLYGLVFAILFAFINFLKWAKYWELVKDKVEK